ncbi:TonB-dependent receptor plug domain-containing protein [Pseudomonadota bacterium]
MHSLLRTIPYLLILGASSLSAQTMDEEEAALLGLYGDEELISIATGIYQPIAKAPAVATVITAEDIRAMGATDLDQILETVPGLHAAYDPATSNPIYTIRGVYTQFNPQVLLLVNGIPMQSLFKGDRHGIWGGMPLEAIKRIEVIRGPGSAIYGADAFSGVINIHTKSRRDIDKVEFGVRAGSFDTQDFWALYGGDWGGLEVAGVLEIHNTDGHSRTVTEDGATALGTSLAPGSVNLGRQNLDARIDIAYELWKLRAGYQRRRNQETGFGLAYALDPQGRFASDRWNADLTYHNPEFTTDWDVQAQASFSHTTQEVEEDIILYPAGTDFDAAFGNIFGIGTFTEGMIGNPEVFERHWRLDFSALYSGIDRHKIRLGTGYSLKDIYKVKEEKNFTFTAINLGPPFGVVQFPDPTGSLDDVSDDPNRVFLSEEDRRNYYFYLQDIWQFANDWELTAGVRYDHYNDFGDTYNPRLALVWSTGHNLTNKFMFGRAFRAPSFAESQAQNNPVALGNDSLDPETMQTFEWAVDYRPQDDLRLGANLFKYKWKDIIKFIPDAAGGTSTAQNAGEQTGYGLEFEADWQPRQNLRLMGNYAYQRSEDKEADHVAGNAPEHQIYLRGDWEFIPAWHLDTQLNWVGERKRVDGDTRPNVDDYTTLNMTLRYKNKSNPWEVAVAGRNLFNSDRREPSLYAIPAPAIPNDLPLAGRSVFVEFRYSPE